MFERFRSTRREERGGVATAPETETVEGPDREPETEWRRFARDDEAAPTEEATATHEPTTTVARPAEPPPPARTVQSMRARQREEFGGISWGSAFFGWLVAIGMAAMLIGLLSAAGAAFGLSELHANDAGDDVETLGIIGGALLIVVLVVAYYSGGYVSGRMSRFDGARQGFAVWLLGVVVTGVLALAAVLFGSRYNVLERLELPRIPVDEGTLTTGAAIALAIVLLGTLVAALAGGRSGERFHARVDRFGYDS